MAKNNPYKSHIFCCFGIFWKTFAILRKFGTIKKHWSDSRSSGGGARGLLISYINFLGVCGCLVFGRSWFFGCLVLSFVLEVRNPTVMYLSGARCCKVYDLARDLATAASCCIYQPTHSFSSSSSSSSIANFQLSTTSSCSFATQLAKLLSSSSSSSSLQSCCRQSL